MKNLLNKLFERFFKTQHVEETKAVVEIPTIIETAPVETIIIFKEPIVTCKCNCGNKDCKCDVNCSCENCGCKCDSNCACKNKKQPVKKQPVKKQPVKKTAKQPIKKQPAKKVNTVKNKPGKPKNKKK
jgi:hypothetical protein